MRILREHIELNYIPDSKLHMKSAFLRKLLYGSCESFESLFKKVKSWQKTIGPHFNILDNQ